jgi:hypothetical protein
MRRRVSASASTRAKWKKEIEMTFSQRFGSVGLAALAMLMCANSPAGAQEWSSARPDGHAPIGVMGDHTHERGEVMLSYRYMPMSMNGNRDGTTQLSPADVLTQFPVTPLRMSMSMHMLGVMAAPTRRLTLMGMVPIVDASMDHQTRAGGMFDTEATGLGDVKITGLLRMFNRDQRAMHLNLGLSLPTGTIDETDITPASAPDAAILPYPMQFGSGTWDLLPGVTLLGQNDRWSWGAQARTTIRLGENTRNYRLGNRGIATGWIAARLNDWVSTSGRVQGTMWGDVHGADPALNPNVVPTADPNLRGGGRLDVGVGLNFEVAGQTLHGQRLAIEFLAPAYQDLHGPQLEDDWELTMGWQYAFRAWGSS